MNETVEKNEREREGERERGREKVEKERVNNIEKKRAHMKQIKELNIGKNKRRGINRIKAMQTGRNEWDTTASEKTNLFNMSFLYVSLSVALNRGLLDNATIKTMIHWSSLFYYECEMER